MTVSAKIFVDLDMDGKNIKNAADGVDPQDVATVAQLTGAGVSSIAKSGDTPLTGDVTFSEGANVTLTQTGNDIEIAATGGGGGGGGTPSSASVTTTAAQSIGNSSVTVIAFTAEEWDDAGYHDNSTDNTRLTVPEDGTYEILAWVPWGPDNSFTRRFAQIVKNGTDVLERSEIDAISGSSGEISHTLSVIDEATAGDYYELYVFQNTGGSLDVQFVSSTDLRPRFQIIQQAAASMGELDKDVVTAGVSIAGSYVTLFTLTATFNGSDVVFEVSAPAVAIPDGAQLDVALFEDGSNVGFMNVQGNSGSSPVNNPFSFSTRYTPAAGSHTYTIQALCSAGTATMQADTGGSGNYLPASARVAYA